VDDGSWLEGDEVTPRNDRYRRMPCSLLMEYITSRKDIDDAFKRLFGSSVESIAIHL
jgi:hypothetical protein